MTRAEQQCSKHAEDVWCRYCKRRFVQSECLHVCACMHASRFTSMYVYWGCVINFLTRSVVVTLRMVSLFETFGCINFF